MNKLRRDKFCSISFSASPMKENDHLDLECLRHVRGWQDWVVDRLQVEQGGVGIENLHLQHLKQHLEYHLVLGQWIKNVFKSWGVLVKPNKATDFHRIAWPKIWYETLSQCHHLFLPLPLPYRCHLAPWNRLRRGSGWNPPLWNGTLICQYPVTDAGVYVNRHSECCRAFFFCGL